MTDKNKQSTTPSSLLAKLGFLCKLNKKTEPTNQLMQIPSPSQQPPVCEPESRKTLSLSDLAALEPLTLKNSAGSVRVEQEILISQKPPLTH